MKLSTIIFSLFLFFCHCPPLCAATFVVGSNSDSQDNNPGDGICQTLGGPFGECSLKAAIEEANAHQGSDTIVFSAPLTFSLASTTLLPPITDSNLTIDGSSQWNAGDDIPGIVMDNYLDITSLTVNNGISNTVITGLLFTGQGTGIAVRGGTGTRIGGPGTHERNVFYGTGTGVYLEAPSTGSIVQYNYFGTKNGETYGDDSIYLGNRGVHVFGTGAGPANIIEHNVIGEQDIGILLEGSIEVTVRNNFIGEQYSSSNVKLANEIGIGLNNTNATITGNVIAYNMLAQITTTEISAGSPDISNNYIGEYFYTSAGLGIQLAFPQGATISGNLIRKLTGAGISVNIGTLNIENNTIYDNSGDGIYLSQTFSGTTVTGNAIRNNNLHGIHLSHSVSAVVSGNMIGFDGIALDGGNGGSGIYMENSCTNNLIGGADATAANYIGHNAYHGIYLTDAGSTGNFIAGNIIGSGKETASYGYIKAGNGRHGIAVYDGAESNSIGLSGSIISPNIILDSGYRGIAIINSNFNTIWGNMIGTDGLNRKWGNSYSGIHVIGNNNVIKANEISGNGYLPVLGQAGIVIEGASSFGNKISENSIYANAGAGIELKSGGNQSIAPPTLQRNDNILSGTTCAGCTVEFFSGKDMDEGAYFEGSTQANGLGNFSLIKLNRFRSTYVTATATSSPTTNTSQFSLPVEGYTFPWAQFLPAILP